MKLYCINCKYHRSQIIIKDGCIIRTEESSFYDICLIPFNGCINENKNKDCDYYETKWYKFLVKRRLGR